MTFFILQFLGIFSFLFLRCKTGSSKILLMTVKEVHSYSRFHQMIESQIDLSCLPIGSQSQSIQVPWQPQGQDRSHIQGNLSVEQYIQEELRQRITGLEEAQCTLSSEGSIPGQTTASRGNLEHLNASNAGY
ncbi:hypothetical protein RJ641_023304 [Dillenia turbinata]|uniref:Uncharacterized protein n=1 Tax=Dillenia turbinata TaxID=194707 RepID=A0AAN8UG81_9MAGN